MQTVIAGPEEIEEERRLAYVAITRAKDELYILHTASRTIYGRTAANPASRFLDEIPEHLLSRPAIKQRMTNTYAGYSKDGGYRTARETAAADRITVGKAQAKPAAPREILAAGDRVKHMLFGEGEVLSVQKMGTDYLYEIAFDTKGTKKLMATYAKLQKI